MIGEVIFVIVVQVGQPNQLKYIIALRNDKKSFYRGFLEAEVFFIKIRLASPEYNS